MCMYVYIKHVCTHEYVRMTVEETRQACIIIPGPHYGIYNRMCMSTHTHTLTYTHTHIHTHKHTHAHTHTHTHTHTCTQALIHMRIAHNFTCEKNIFVARHAKGLGQEACFLSYTSYSAERDAVLCFGLTTSMDWLLYSSYLGGFCFFCINNACGDLPVKSEIYANKDGNLSTLIPISILRSRCLRPTPLYPRGPPVVRMPQDPRVVFYQPNVPRMLVTAAPQYA